MFERPVRVRTVEWNRGLAWFIGLELLCVAGCFVMLRMGQTKIATAFLLGPFQLLIWSILLSSGQSLLAVFTVLLPLAGARMLPYTYELFVYMPGTVMLLCLLALTSYLFAGRPDRVRLRASEWFPLCAIGIWTIASGLNATTRGWGCQFLLVMTLVTVQAMLLAYFFATVPRSLTNVRMLLYMLVAAAVFVALCVPFIQTSSGGFGAFGGKMVETPFGFVNLNTIAYVLGPTSAVALGMAVGARRRRTRFLLWSAVFVCAMALVLTKSRGGWLGFAAGFLYLMARKRSLLLLVSAAAVCLAVVLSDVLRALFVSRAVATTAYDPSLLGRFVLWDYAWRIGKANWLLGVGMENFRYVKHFFGFPMPLKFGIDFNAHNVYFETFVDLGVMGLALFLWMLVSSFVRSFRAAGTAESGDLGLGLSAGIVAYAAHGLFDCVLFQPGVFALLALLVGLSASLRRLTRVERVPHQVLRVS